MSFKTRIHAEERKQKIIDAAKPLFAHSGFNGTSIRDIAKAANISNALLYKHFPSKEALYKEIHDFPGWLSSVLIKKIELLEPSTETLIFLLFAIYRIILFKVPGSGGNQKIHERLLFHSLLEENAYARRTLNRLYDDFKGIIGKNFLAAEKSGDTIQLNTSKRSRFWFAHHLAMGLNLCHISKTPAFDYDTTYENLVDDAVFFALRGIGITDSAIAKYYDPARLKKEMNVFLKN